MTYTTLLPARMGRLELRNRIVFPAMVTNYCSTRGEVTDRLVAYHQERAKGGAGLLITEATYISPDGKSFPHQLGIDDDGLLPGLRRLVESVHAAGARIAVQLCHAGRQTSRAVTGLPLLSPSVTRFGNDETSAMRQEDIDRVLRDYAGAALRAQKAGFDAVELHAGNGYLPQQFLSPFTNARQDGYGGSLENRVRFTVEAIRSEELTVCCKNKTRTIFLPPQLRKALSRYAARRNIRSGPVFVTRSGNCLDRSNVWAKMKRLCAAANVASHKVYPHNLRKLFARTFYTREKDIALLADILGHGSIETTRIYIMSTGKEHRQKIEHLNLLM